MSAVLKTVSDPVSEHFIGRLLDAEVKTVPYPRIYVTRAFPQYYYEEILENLPTEDKYTDRQFDNRMMVQVKDLGSFWRHCNDWLTSREVIGTLYQIFKLDVRKIKVDVRLVRDSKGYRIKPHTDIKTKLLSLLFYLARDEDSPDEGTTIMTPKKHGFTSDGTTRFPFDEFDDFYTAPFLPNTMLCFPRSEVSFHGVRGTKITTRDVLLLNLYRV